MTTPHSRLLLATEHTEFDTGAERIALELARRRGVPLAAVVPIVSNIEYESVAPGLVARMEEDVHARLVALQDEAAHAGWKGAIAGVTDATLAAMEGLGASRANIAVAIGPCMNHRPGRLSFMSS